jgi:hypothetical protein
MFFPRVLRMLLQNLILRFATNLKFASQMNVGAFQHSSHVGPPEIQFLCQSSGAEVHSAMQ